jgi:hypothetical protein
LNSTLRKGAFLLSLVVAYSMVAWFYGILLWFDKFSFLKSLALPLTTGFLLLWFLFGYKSRLGFSNGIFIGVIGAIPILFFTVVQALILLTGRVVEGTLFGLYNPGTVALMWFYNAFQQWRIDLVLLPYLLIPLLILLCGLGSHLGRVIKKEIKIRPIYYLFAAIIFIMVSAVMLFDQLHVSKSEAINIVENHTKEYGKELKFKIGKVIKVEERFSEEGTVPQQWRVELLTDDGGQFANYWVNATDGKFGFGLTELGHQLLEPKVGNIIVRTERWLRFGEEMNFDDFDAIVLNQNGNVDLLLVNKTGQELAIKIEVIGDTTEILLKTLKSNEKLEEILPFGNKIIIYDGRGNKAIWE